jgi:hypothetical protein|tara:strand:- start:1132 stop:1515 length:384 start_codon:yes stop_codon:yes gene_type:complete
MKTFKDLVSTIKELRVISVAQRRKIGRRMARLAKTSAFKAKKERAMKKIASPMKQRIKANKMAKKIIINKFYKNYDNMSPMQRMKVDQLIKAKYGATIDKIAKRSLIKVKKGEIEKVKKARMANKDD